MLMIFMKYQKEGTSKCDTRNTLNSFEAFKNKRLEQKKLLIGASHLSTFYSI